jgi:hypothetical protein
VAPFNPFSEPRHPLFHLESEKWWARVDKFAEHFSDLLGSMSPSVFHRFLNRYGLFNRAFAGAGLCLAGKIHLRQDIFGDETAALIAASVLAALVEEYIAPDGGRRTHRHLCNFFVNEANRLSGLLAGAPDASLATMQSDISGGYSVSSNGEDAELISALGFHLATELNGVVEFTILDKVMRQRFPKLVASLEACLDGSGTNAYSWVSAHVIVEHDHLAAALEARDLALTHYIGSLTQDVTSESFQHGIATFYELADKHLLST